MADAQRNAHVDRLREAKRKLKTATGIHRKDLLRHIHRLQKELRTYDKYRKGGTPCPVAHTPTASPT